MFCCKWLCLWAVKMIKKILSCSFEALIHWIFLDLSIVFKLLLIVLLILFTREALSWSVIQSIKTFRIEIFIVCFIFCWGSYLFIVFFLFNLCYTWWRKLSIVFMMQKLILFSVLSERTLIILIHFLFILFVILNWNGSL